MSNKQNLSPKVLSYLTSKQAWYYKVLPFDVANGSLYFYSVEVENSVLLENELELITGKKAILNNVTPEKLAELLHYYYPNENSDMRKQDNYFNGNPDIFLPLLIKEARNLKSSDIHIEAFEEFCRARIRIDGMLVRRYLLDRKQYPSFINRIKIIANLDIAEKRLPQDGRILFEVDGVKFDIRVSVLPTLHGEKIVLRLLNNDATDINIDSLGFSEFDLKNYLEGIKKPNGILLISGPTGSGKTTTLYATLKLLNQESRNILTIEDPVEYTLEGINQVQLKESIGLNFTAALRTFLRQDPDIIMLGEIRDGETANMAIRAALTGHLVLSTIHTNSAWGIVSRLIDMGIAPYLLANTLNTAVAQRLIRLLCRHCKIKMPLNNSIYPRKFKPFRSVEFHYTAKGCAECFGTGYKGRKAVYEVIQIDEEFSEQIKSSNYNVTAKIREKGIKSLTENAFELFETGETSLDEIYSLLIN
ncbi:MAG: type II/IV secretion system protein [Bacteroidetes bacterium]|nr:MAG: type II/IV secretion system protein [Bacteroidota bacterium]